jgi:hypothetical protein
MANSAVDDELWEAFHAAVNMTSRELADWLREERAGTEPTAGDPGWRHSLMSIGHDPLKER